MARNLRGTVKYYFPPVAAILLVFVAWELFVLLAGMPRFMLVGPIETFTYIINRPDIVLNHGLITASETLGGFAIGASLGLVVAILIVYSSFLKTTIYPLIIASQVVPKVAIAPFIVLWLGQGPFPKMVVASILAFFPVLVNTALGMESVQREMLDLAKSLKTGPVKIFTKIRVPNALPLIFAGLKVGAILAVIGAIVGEYIAGSVGLGYMIIIATDNRNLAFLFAGVLASIFLSMVLFAGISLLERRMIPWFVASRKQAGT